AKKIVALAQDSDILAIETTFLEEDAERAMEKYHLTARQAGMLARAAHAKKIIPFHFSPKYAGQEPRLREELHDAYTGNR
ncbi:MAG TPA: ribonuclease Z, partial [Gammaproteobacteria bacterium]|nr:ribonuclease Z [Gammaproteobacteria bacterium]